jgi:hypothetical protein
LQQTVACGPHHPYRVDCLNKCFSYKLTIASKIEEANLKQNQVKLKQLYDKYAMKRKFKSGENVIVFLLIRCLPLHATYCWPFVIESRLIKMLFLSIVDYLF